VASKVKKLKDDGKRVYDQSVTRAAIILECAGTTVQRYADSGRLPHIRDSSNRRLFCLSDIERLKRSQRSQPPFGNQIGNQRPPTVH
jgi:hypothetical protein